MSLFIHPQAQMAEQEQQKLLKTQAAKYAQHQAGLAAAAVSHAEPPLATPQDPTLQSAGAAAFQAEEAFASHVASPSGGDSETSGRKRRRTAVDYVALNKQLEAEAAGPSGHSTSQQTGNAANIPPSFVTDVPATSVGIQATNAVPGQRPDTPMNRTALSVEQQHAPAQQPHEGDKLS